MKQTTQVIAASGLTILLLLFQWPGANGRLVAAAALRAEQQSSTNQAGDARAIFDSKCATCHGKDGRAKTMKAKFNKARNLTDAAWQAEVSDERIYNSIANGRGKKMPVFAKKLSRAEIEGLVGHVRSLKK